MRTKPRDVLRPVDDDYPRITKRDIAELSCERREERQRNRSMMREMAEARRATIGGMDELVRLLGDLDGDDPWKRRVL